MRVPCLLENVGRGYSGGDALGSCKRACLQSWPYTKLLASSCSVPGVCFPCDVTGCACQHCLGQHLSVLLVSGFSGEAGFAEAVNHSASTGCNPLGAPAV